MTLTIEDVIKKHWKGQRPLWVEAAMTEYASLHQCGGWVSVEKDLPDFDEFVLWTREDGTIFWAEIDHDCSWQTFQEMYGKNWENTDITKITHWMRIAQVNSLTLPNESTSCKVDELRKEIEDCKANHLNINYLLNEFTRRGFDVSNWDGDEGAEKAIVDGVCNDKEKTVDWWSEELATMQIERNDYKNKCAEQSKRITELEEGLREITKMTFNDEMIEKAKQLLK